MCKKCRVHKNIDAGGEARRVSLAFLISGWENADKNWATKTNSCICKRAWAISNKDARKANAGKAEWAIEEATFSCFSILKKQTINMKMRKNHAWMLNCNLKCI